MNLETGLFARMVVQRNRKNVSEAAFTGACAATGPILATVRQGGRAVKGFSGVTVGKAARGRMTGCLKGLPAGGPYDIELKAGAETLAVKDVLVGDVWLLGGQSNMQGCGLFPKKVTPADPRVRAFYMDDRWATAKDPIHNMWACVDQAHVDLCGGARPAKPGPGWGVCPGPSFGAAMLRRTGVPQGLIACAHGGTTMTQWDPKRKNEGGKSLYGALVRRLTRNGGRVAGMIWYQGCSDANPAAAPLYTKRMRELVACLRRDCADKALPVAIVQIARVIGWGAANTAPWNSIQDQQRRLPLAIKTLATVPAIDLPLDDNIHISGAGQQVLGERLAQAMQSLHGDRAAGLPPIALKKVSVEAEPGRGVVVAEFDNVIGRLVSGSRPTGFSIVSQAGVIGHFDTVLDGNKVRVRSASSAGMLSEGYLHYGTDPICNITDEAGRSLPVFGPVRLGTPRALTPFVQKLRVSAYQPGAGKLQGLKVPANPKALGLTLRSFPGIFCDLHEEIGSHGGKDEVLWFAFSFSCPEPMPAGTNPAFPDKGKAAFKAKAGKHEALVALGTNKGAAWGVHLCLERTDVSTKLLLMGPEHYALPAILG
jgi:sialate O-acetylesterase